MSYSLPPLNPLKAFETAARCGSLAKAADELGVTPAAIGQQVRVLEGYFGVILFRRGHGMVSLTREGELLFDGVERPLRDIDFALQQARHYQNENEIVIRSYTTLTQFWLFPRLPRFFQQHPTISVDVKSPPPPIPQTDTENLDAVFRVGTGTWHDLSAIRIAPIVLVPVCALEYAERLKLRKPSDLSRATLLGSAHRKHDWPAYARSAGVSIAKTKLTEFESSGIAYEAAISGLGVALAVQDFIRPQIEQGRVIVPFTHPFDTTEGFYFTWSKSRSYSPALETFRRWLVAELES